MTQYQLFATTAKAKEGILADEMQALGAHNVQQKLAGVAFQGDLALAYQACLWLRTASRVLLIAGLFLLLNDTAKLSSAFKCSDQSMRCTPS